MFTGFFLHYYYYWNFVTLLFIFLFKNMPVVLCTATEVIFSIMAKVKMLNIINGKKRSITFVCKN